MLFATAPAASVHNIVARTNRATGFCLPSHEWYISAVRLSGLRSMRAVSTETKRPCVDMAGNPKESKVVNIGRCVDRMASSPLLGPAMLKICGVRPRMMSAEARLLWMD